MQRKFLTNLGLLLALNLLIKPFWVFGIDRTVQNMVGVADFGFYFIIFNFSFLFNILLDLGITNFNNKNIAQNSQLLTKHFSGILVVKLLLAILYFLITFTIALILGYNMDQLKLLALLGFNQFLISFILYLRSNVSGLLHFRTDSLLSVLDRALMILFCSVLIWGHVTTTPFRIEWFVYSQTAAYALTALIAFLVVVKKAKFRRLNWNWPFILLIIKQSFPFALLFLLTTFNSRLDPVMLEKLLPNGIGNQQAGVYATGFRILDAANMIAYLFSVLLIPIFAKMIKNKESIERMVKLSFTLIITFAILIAIGSYFYSFELMRLLYHTHIEASKEVFQLLMFSFIFVSSSYIFGTLLTANGNLKTLNFIAFGGFIINFVLNVVLVPQMLAVGSAVAALSTQLFMAIIQVIMAQRIFKFRINFHYLFTLIIFIVGVIALNMLSKVFPIRISFIPDTLSWLPSFSLMLLGSAILAGLLRLWNFRSLLKIVREDH